MVAICKPVDDHRNDSLAGVQTGDHVLCYGMKLRVLIADDEPLSRQRLRQFVRAEPGVELVAECVNGMEAVKIIREKSPDLAFLDVKMPELDGFGVVEALNGTGPVIIFVTAYDRFAVQAFEANAVDYLLKPFDRERFRTALRRACERLRRVGSDQHNPALLKLLTDAGKRPKPLERLTFKSDGRICVVKTADIAWIGGADNYVELHTGTRTHLLRTTITALAGQLSPDRFVRISRSHLVNLEHIKEMRPKSHGDFLILLHNGTTLPGTRNYRHNLAQVVGKAK
jgi:two-component system LytT family response regulator